MRRLPLLLLSLLLCSACSHQAELKQEIAVANDLLPAPLSIGLTADSITLEGQEVVYHITMEEGYVDADLRNPRQRQIFKELTAAFWTSESSQHLLDRLEQAGCRVAYHFTRKGDGDTCSVLFTTQELREALP